MLYIGNRLTKHGLPPTTADTLPPKLEAAGFEVIAVSDKKNKILRLWNMLHTVFKNRKNADVVLIDTYSSQNFYYAVLVATVCRFYAIPYIPILHGGNLPARLRKSKRTASRLFKKSKTNVAPSAYLYSEFEKAGVTNLTYIPNALALEKYPFSERSELRYNLLWVRSFAKIYNPDLALEVVEILQKRGKKVSLCMVGPEKDGSLQRCKKIVEKRKLPVKFTGLLKTTDWIALSKEFDVFINTTNFDNMPVSVMEAMALGIPIVSTSVGGIPFLIENGKTGVLVPPKNAEAFADAVENAIENTAQTLRKTHNARTEVEKMDWEIIKKSWISLLKKI